MKTFKLLKNIGLVLFLGLTITACSSSDDSKGGGSSKLLENVPKGEIVPTAQRFAALTGYDESAATKSTSSTALNADLQKWWTMKDAGYEYWCGSEHEKGNEEVASGAIGFTPNGKIYVKYSSESEPSEYAEWKWTDSSKSKITIIDTLGEEEESVWEFTKLNGAELIFANIAYEMGCEGVYWEQYKSDN